MNVIDGWEGQTLAIVVGGVVLAGPVAAWRWGNKHVASPLKEIPIIKADLGVVKVDVQNMKEQFTTNGGGSLRDSNNRTETLVRAVVRANDLNPEQIAPAEADES
jgi:hypothetical protein